MINKLTAALAAVWIVGCVGCVIWFISSSMVGLFIPIAFITFWSLETLKHWLDK